VRTLRSIKKIVEGGKAFLEIVYDHFDHFNAELGLHSQENLVCKVPIKMSEEIVASNTHYIQLRDTSKKPVLAVAGKPQMDVPVTRKINLDDHLPL